ncbi:serinc-domain containing serine and sphingolipid biosynthesis protein [Tasmannia lanceolata]|uniref:serinc-domain containing serine and sphingolipid biosynthesis protein n=1 Tax=Tasmannia lanceolata TaxID=3420 RepID=UPI0040639BEC
MVESLEIVVENKFAEGKEGSLEVTQWEEAEPAKPTHANYSVEKKNSLQARYAYGFIFLLTNLMAWFVRDYGHKVLVVLRDLKACGTEGRDCFRTEGVLRVSLGCFIFFSLMFVTTFRSCKLYEACNAWHSRWWALKIVILIVSMGVPFFISLDFIRLYGEVARIGAGIFLVLQLISVIQFITWWNNYWMPDTKLKHSSFLGLLMSTIFYIASICGIVVMYLSYAPGHSCTLNIFFITWTAILLKVMMLVSLHSKVNRGLLSSGIMSSYVVFLCWSAIRSEPAIEKCSPQKTISGTGNGDWTTIFGFLIAICSIVMATFSTGIDSQSFQFCKNKVQSEDDIPYNYGFFHFTFSMGAMYFAMLFISWDLHNSTRKWSIDVGWASTWVKIVNEWFAAAIYLWTLISPVVRRAKIMDHEESVQHMDNLA